MGWFLLGALFLSPFAAVGCLLLGDPTVEDLWMALVWFYTDNEIPRIFSVTGGVLTTGLAVCGVACLCKAFHGEC